MVKKVIIGIVLGVVILFISINLTMNGENVGAGKTDFDPSNYYSVIDFDFIIPKPWYSQIPEIKNMGFVEDVVPFYLINKSLSTKSKSSNIDIYIIERNANVDITPFSQSLTINGKMISEGNIVLDEQAKDILEASVGDEISMSLENSLIKLKTSGIVQKNQFATRPTAVIYYTGNVKSSLENSIANLAYSGAYVKARDISAAENYFNTTYRAMGKVGERSWYKDDSSYEYMKNSIQGTNVSKEITNVAQIRANAISSYKEAKKVGNINLVYATISVFILNFLTWFIIVIGSSKQYRERIKLGTKISAIIKEFVIGEILTTVIFVVGISLLRAVIGMNTMMILMFAIITSCIILLVVTNKIISRKKNQQNLQPV